MGVDAADDDPSLLGVEEALEEGDQCGLARPRATHDGHRLARLGGEGDVGQSGVVAGLVGERDVVEGHRRTLASGVEGDGPRPVDHVRHGGVDVGDCPRGGHPHVPRVPVAGELAERAEALVGQHQHEEERRNVEVAAGHPYRPDPHREGRARPLAQSGEPAVDESGGQMAHGLPVQRAGPVDGRLAVAADGVARLEGGDALQPVDEVGVERLVRLPVLPPPAPDDAVGDAGPDGDEDHHGQRHRGHHRVRV